MSAKIVLKDFLSQAPIDKLKATLSGHLPVSCITKDAKITSLQPGYHFLFFSLASPESNLNSDGYESLYSPKPNNPFSFKHRIWLHGVLRFHRPLHLFQTSECHELIQEESVKSPSITKEVETCLPKSSFLTKPTSEKQTKHVYIRRKIYDSQHQLCIEEDRTLAYLNRQELAIPKTLRSKSIPQHSWVFTPTPIMVFRYSALMFNAHMIHWNATYATKSENYPNLVLPGPLLVTSMLEYFRSVYPQMSKNMKRFEFRLLSPAFVNQPLRICISETGNLWIDRFTTDLDPPSLIARGRVYT
ncbi:Hydroxyacyl-thioester dehydratase type 2, mitochondrial [Schizosaccharomyces pombe]